MPALRRYIYKCYPVPRPPDTRSSKREGPWWIWYNEYLKSAIWAEVRRRVIARVRGGLCEVCRAAAATDAHHLTYDRAGHERWGDLQAVCLKCHEEIHGHACRSGRYQERRET